MTTTTRIAMRAAVFAGLMTLGHGAMAQAYYFDLYNLSDSGTTQFNIGTWSLAFRSNVSGAACSYSSSNGGACNNVEVEAQVHRGVLELDFYRIGNGNNAPGNPPNLHSGALVQGSTGSFTHTLALDFTVYTPTPSGKGAVGVPGNSGLFHHLR